MKGEQFHFEQPDERKVLDTIHGFIKFEKRIWKFIDTPEFQRLKNIKQLGSLHHVFPGATHTRFEHSLGTAHLAKKFIKLLIKNNKRNQDVFNAYKNTQIKKSAIFTVTLAGLMHDIGHGPFSHTFDNSVVKANVHDRGQTQGGLKWQHQIGSAVIFEYISEKYGFVGKQSHHIITPEEVKRVKKLIDGKDKLGEPRVWEFQLISNKQTGIDVDKLDYFRRDAYYLGAKGLYVDHELLMNQARIIENYICYPSKYNLAVNRVFTSRYELYRTYYLNNKAKGIEFMICDILKEVEPLFEFSKICSQIKQGSEYVQRYTDLTDNILDRIKSLKNDEKIYNSKGQQVYKYSKDNQNRIKRAQKLLSQISQRKIYRFVREINTSISTETLKDQNEKSKIKEIEQIFNIEKIKQAILDKTDGKIKDQDIRIAITDVGYGMKEINPLDQVKFFRKELKPYKILSKNQFKAENTSLLYTKSFAERYAKLYMVAIEDEDILEATQNAFKNYFSQNLDKKKIPYAETSYGTTQNYRALVQNVNRANLAQNTRNQLLELIQDDDSQDD